MATSPASVGFSFDAKNREAQRVAARQGAALVREVSNETKRAIRVVVVQAIRRGVPPLEAARQIRELVGLTERQALAVQHFRENLQNTGMIPSRIDAAVSRFAAKKLRERAENIARTETMGALNKGTLQAWRQAQDEGVLSEDALKEWITTPDDRLCEVCRPLDGQKRPRDEAFSTSVGNVQSPPVHPQCRCTVGIAFERKA